ncbi:hypothetical protein N7457_002263 [Penicillium paradoxum]|uniref:uncharacterized protein n=1 Tax=Penicillium paradoxum TaxID=176176 RepID=UPI002546C1D0|nr:uncharacterized protein N7457_002263 [Penicillium paradoxum]KAJ5787273.1 hypothetical protein N7457_002263 [Penicillium paradoxum]
MWREPSKAEASRSALEKDISAAARSPIRRGPSSRHTSSRARRSGILSSFHSQIIDELRRDAGEPRRVPRFSFIPPNGSSETGIDSVTLEQAEREALNRANPRASVPRQAETGSRRNRSSRDPALANLLSRMDGQARIVHGSPSLTPNFAPAFNYAINTTTPSDSGVRLPPMRGRDIHTQILAPMNDSELHPQPPANAFFPPEIRDARSSNTQTRPSRDSLIDGLGDRLRSPSPDGDRESDSWETLLATITPDATLPSTDASFTSNSSAPDVSRTVLSRSAINLPHGMPVAMGVARAHFGLDPYPDNVNPCDFDSSDDEEAPFSYNELMRRGPSIPSSNRRFHSQPSTFSNHPPVPAFAVSLSDHHQDGADLQRWQVMIDRLARRRDITDDWWAAVGLARTLDPSLNASMDSTDTEGPSRTNRPDN